MCGLGKSSSVAFFTCIRSDPAQPSLTKMPLFTNLLPSLRDTILRNERSDFGPMCLYLCAYDDDEFLQNHAKDLRKHVMHYAHFMSLRLQFFPSNAGVREIALGAWADRAQYLHHVYEDNLFSRGGWLRAAISALQQDGVGAVSPALKRVCSPPLSCPENRSRNQPIFVSRRHMATFRDFYPPQLQDWAFAPWISGTYATKFVADGKQPLPTGTARSLVAGSLAGAVAATTDARPRATAILPALIECGRHVLATHPGNTSAPPATCTAHANKAAAALAAEARAEDTALPQRLGQDALRDARAPLIPGSRETEDVAASLPKRECHHRTLQMEGVEAARQRAGGLWCAAFSWKRARRSRR